MLLKPSNGVLHNKFWRAGSGSYQYGLNAFEITFVEILWAIGKISGAAKLLCQLTQALRVAAVLAAKHDHRIRFLT